jgi:SAM-dependent methyltransferase
MRPFNPFSERLGHLTAAWWLGFFFCGAWPLAWAQEPLRVLVAAHELDALRDAVAAYTEREGGTVEIITVPHNEVLPAVYAEQGPFDALVASCNRSAKRWEERGFVVPASRRELYWKRMAIFLLPGNPKGILRHADLTRPGVRIGLQRLCPGRVDQTVEALRANVALEASDARLLAKLLREGDLDAVVTLDASLAEEADSLVAIRLPRAIYGPEGATPVMMYVTVDSPHPEAAAKLTEFLGKSPYATDVYLAHALLLSDGVKDAQSYDTVVSPKYALVYHNNCQQIIDDYHIIQGQALDIGCGPGQMTLELARMTQLSVVGLDIEPEAIEIATRHAAEAGLSDRVQFVAADAHQLPFPEASFDLVVARGTWPFLRNHVLAFQEVYRVMKPGAVAFIGGGMGRYTPPEEVAKLRPKGPQKGWFRSPEVRREDTIFPFPLERYEILMARAGIPPSHYRVIMEGGQWVEIRK